MKHGFIGFGNLANAVYEGLKEEQDIEFAYCDIIRKEVTIPFHDRMDDLVSFAEVIWLMGKPPDLPTILEGLRPLDRIGKAIVSPAAGKDIASIERYLGKEQLIVRIMPNLAMAYRKSVTAFATNQPKNEKGMEIFNLLGKLGKAVPLEESGFDLFTAIFGSGPAFILSFIQTFKDKMQEFNLPEPLLDELLLELTEGTALYFGQIQKGYTIEQLIQNITSKGGTTQAGLDYFRTHEIGKQLEGIVDAARERSKEMSKQGK